MTSRFRSNWAEERSQSNLVSLDSGSRHDSHHSLDDEFRGKFYCNDCPDDDIALGEDNDKGILQDRSLDNRNGKLRERSDPGMSHYVDDREFDDDREKSSATATSYHRSSCREDFRFRGDAAVENYSQRERRVPIGKRGTTSSFAIGSSIARYDLRESANDEENFESRLTSTSLMTTTSTTTTTAAATTTNGNTSMSPQTAGNGSTKQVKRIEPRRDHHRTIGSLTRGERPVIEDLSIVGANPRSNDVTNRTSIRTNESLNGSKRGRSVNRTSRNDRNDEFRSPTRAVCQEIDDYGPMDRSAGMRATRDRSYSPIERLANGSNGDSLDRRSDRRRNNSRSDERFYSPVPRFEDDQVFHSLERRSRRHADGSSYSPTDNNNGRVANGTTKFATNRSHSRDKHHKLEMVGSSSKRLGLERDNDDGANGMASHKTSRTQRENGSSKKPSEIEDNDCHTKKGSSGKKSHTRYKASPEEFDVQIHRYERALRVPRRDSDLSRKTSFKSQESDLSRKSSFEDHQRSKDSNPSKNKNHHKHRNSELARGSSEDRDDVERVSRKNSFMSRDTDLTRKSSLTRRNLLDTGPVHDNDNSNNNHHINNNGNTINNNHNGNNGSHQRDRSESLRRDHDSSITRRRPSRCNDDDDEDDEDYDQSSGKNDRHSRPLTPPKQLVNLKDRDDSRDRRSRMSCSALKERTSKNEDDSARNYVQDHNDCRSKKNTGIESLSAPQGHDRFSSSTRRVASTRSLNDTRQDNSNGRSGARIDTAVGNKQSTREFIVDEQDPCDDDDHLSFSTIERNGTTVIKIRTNSQSPVGQTEPARPRRRTSHRDNATTPRYRKYEDEAEDEDEDDETFGRNYRRRDYRVGPRRLWTNRDGGVQITDLDEGQPCLHCGETCPGFSPHSWRKNCTSCKCPREAHDVCHEEWVSVRARLGLKGEGPNNYVGFDPRDRGLTWAPPGLPPSKVEEYFSMLPEISVPRIGTPGERHRDRQLATQLPKQDLARAYCRHLDPQHSASADDFMAARNEIALDIGSVKEILERGHNCGVCHEPLKYGSLAVSASKLGFSYHPSCFQCTQCRELLVDLAYCVHDDALYCERHYAEQLKPRCAACDELIFSGEYTKAMNKDWHSGHFCCWQCDESLTGQRYVLRDEHPYCIKCYESVFANGCEECSKIIGIDSKDLSYKDKHWHEACFLCNKCRVSLVDKQFGSKVDKIYCGNCYDAQFASRCDGCGEIFRAGTKKMEYKTRQWHEKCFCCVVCRNPIGTKSFIPREQEIYCAGCYEDKFATRCVKCNKIITSGGVTYKNEPWHRDCFTCSNCNNSLAGQRFTSRDDKPYCAECFGELFAKRCTACTKPITGIGGTRFISFEDRHWHNNCFICAGCNTSLVGRGFITDGDDIICPECAKQKLSE